MSRGAWAVLLLLVTAAASGAAVLRPAGGGAPAAPAARAGSRRIDAANVAMAAAAAGLAAAAVAIAGHAADRSPGFTELSSVPASTSRDPRMIVTVHSRQPGSTSYLLRISEDGVIEASRHLTLAPNQIVRILTPAVRPSTRRVLVSLSPLSGGGAALHTDYYLPGRPPAPDRPVRAVIPPLVDSPALLPPGVSGSPVR